jgi:hypothetical protein
MANKSTKQGTKVSVCATSQNTDLNQAGYAALTWVPVSAVGRVGDFGGTATDRTYNTLDEPTQTHQKGVGDAGSPDLDCASIYNDAGQIILRSFGDPTNKNNMAIKIERADKPSGYSTGTVFYSRGVVSGPLHVGGGSDDFDVERFSVRLNQLTIRVDPQP